MNVLIIAHHALPHIGGPEILVDREIRALVADGHRVTLIASDLLGEGETPCYPESVRVLRVRAWHVLERRCRLPFPLFGPHLWTLLWREVGCSDVVHAHGFLFMNSVLGLVIARLRGRPCVLTEHGGLQRYQSKLATALARLGVACIGRLSARCANRLVSFNTRITALLEYLAGTPAKSLFLANPVDRELFHPPSAEQRRRARQDLGWATERAKVLFVGRLVPDKGVLLLVQAAGSDFDLAFCGPGDPAILGVLPRPGVEYFPPRTHAELVSLYHAADVLVLPSYREGFPLVVQEALACGLKVVMSDDAGYGPYRDLPGLYFCPLQPIGIRNAILAALNTCVQIPQSTLDQHCPRLIPWVRRLYEDLTCADAALKPGGAGLVKNYTWTANERTHTLQQSGNS